jgi:hypothetical protein
MIQLVDLHPHWLETAHLLLKDSIALGMVYPGTRFGDKPGFDQAEL